MRAVEETERESVEVFLDKFVECLSDVRRTSPAFDEEAVRQLFFQVAIESDMSEETALRHIAAWDEAWRRTLERDRTN